MSDLQDEIDLMEHAEKVIFDIQQAFTLKLGGGYGTLKKAMDIEDFLYKDALYQTGEKETSNVWESLRALSYYKSSAERILKLIKERRDEETDWVKLFNIKDVKSFRQQLTRAVHTQTKRKAPTTAAPPSHFTIPAPGGPPATTTKKTKLSKAAATKKPTVKKPHKTKKAKILEKESRDRQFQQDWEASFNATDDSSTITAGVPPSPTKQDQRKEGPPMTALMHQDSSSSVSASAMASVTSLPEEGGEEDSLLLEGDDSFFATAKLENATDWGSTANGTDTCDDSQNIPSSSTSGWSAAMNERKSQLEQTESKQKHQFFQEDERRRVHEEAYKEVVSKRKEDQVASAEAAVEEEQRVAREREREKREREMQSQNVFMDGDHEALGEYW